MPTGWRPADVQEQFPIAVIDNVYTFERYTTPSSKLFNGYIIFQLLMTTFLLLFMFYNFSNLNAGHLFLYGTLLFLGIYGYTSLMDRAPYAIWVEIARAVSGICIIMVSGDWFGLTAFVAYGSYVLLLYFISTLLGAIYFSKVVRPTFQNNTIA